MSLTRSDLKIYGSAVMPDDDTPTDIGKAIATNRKPCFQDLAGTFQALSSAGGDTTQTVTVSYLDTNGVLQVEVKTLTGTTPVLYTANADRLLKAIKSATSTGDVALESQTATRTGTAQGGSFNSITLDAGASAVDEFFDDYIVRITAGTGSGQIRQIKGYVGATKVATVSWPWATTPDGTSQFRISLGMFFDRQPAEITEVRRIHYQASASAPGGGAKNYYDKCFYQNGSNGLALLTATIKKLSDPSGFLSFGLEAIINGTGGNGAGNNRQVAPSGVVFDSADKVVPGTNLFAGSTIGLWMKLALPDGGAAQKTTVTMSLTGQST